MVHETATQSVIVLGGGMAGFAAATALAEAGVRVTLLEKRSVFGGRARSFNDGATGDVIDNGQHLFMGCYDETLAFLRRIGVENRLALQDDLYVPFYEDGGAVSELRCWPLPSPWHLAGGLLNLRGLSLSDKWAMRRVAEAARTVDPRTLRQITVAQWLDALGQPARVRARFWDLLAVSALNEQPDIASAALFVAALKRMLFGSRQDSRIGVSGVGLSELYVDASTAFIERHGGAVRSNAGAARFLIEPADAQGGSPVCRGVELSNGDTLRADACVSALPWQDLHGVLPPALAGDPWFSRLQRLRPSPILSINLWFDRPIDLPAGRRRSADFVGLLGTNIHWVFNKRQIFARAGAPAPYLAIVISAAHAFIDKPAAELTAMAHDELQRVLPAVRGAAIVKSQVVKEPRATLSAAVDVVANRLEQETPVKGLYLAGDWTACDLPATIESAVWSGHRCAELIGQRTTTGQRAANPLRGNNSRSTMPFPDSSRES